MTTHTKHPGGRPKSTGPIKQRRNVSLLDAEWLELGELGKGSDGTPNSSRGGKTGWFAELI